MPNRKKFLSIALPLVLGGCATPYTITPPQHHANIVWKFKAGDHAYKPRELLASEHKDENGGLRISAPKNTCYITWDYDGNVHYKKIPQSESRNKVYRVEKHGKIYYTYPIYFTVPTRWINTSTRTSWGPPIYMKTSPYRSFFLLFSAATGMPVDIVGYSKNEHGFLPAAGYSLKNTNCVFSVHRQTQSIIKSEKAAYYESYNAKTGKIYFRIYNAKRNPQNSYIEAYPDTNIVRLFTTFGEPHANNYPERKITSYLYIKRIEPNGTLIGRIKIKNNKTN